MNYNTLDEIMSSLYDMEHIDIDKFYNRKEVQQLLEKIERQNKVFATTELTEELAELLQDFLNFETNYNMKLSDLASDIEEASYDRYLDDYYGGSSPTLKQQMEEARKLK